jgi:hypothetical protein
MSNYTGQEAACRAEADSCDAGDRRLFHQSGFS